jgi:hypothetical protein
MSRGRTGSSDYVSHLWRAQRVSRPLQQAIRRARSVADASPSAPTLATAVRDLDASVEESNQGRRDHVGARADLKAVSHEVMKLVG